MKKAIRNFPQQLKFKPLIKNAGKLISTKNFIVSGMGGSHLAADILKSCDPAVNLIVHHDYGLPKVPQNFKNYLIIISSYSGDTAEALDGFKQALERKIPVACVSVGGQLLALAKKYKKPYVKIPNTGIEPRSALGFSLVCLLKLMRQEKVLSQIKKTADSINLNLLEKNGKQLAALLKHKIPVIYTSTRNEALAYNWKIRFNETGKVPSFYNTFPELNHNEMVGFDREKTTKKLSANFHFIFIKDPADHPLVTLRMDVLKHLYEKKGLPVMVYQLKGRNRWQMIFSSLSLADWAAYYTAIQYKLEAQETLIIDKFKKTIKDRSASYEK